ncbi:MAG TPA: LysR substrate-binding domain-containing protein, partial [Rhizobiaceae bacterium]
AAHAQGILDAVEAAHVDMGIAATRPGGRLAIACFGTFAKSHMLPAVIRTRKRHADIEIVVSELEPVDALDALRTGRCDAAIVYAHSLVPRSLDEGFVTRPLVEEPMLLALPRGYAHLPATVELTALADCDWIGGARESEGYTLAERACAVAGFAPRITHSIDDYDLLLHMVAAGFGIGFVPQLALDLYRTEGIVVRTPAGTALRRSISLVARPAVAASPSFLAVLEAFSASAGKAGCR